MLFYSIWKQLSLGGGGGLGAQQYHKSTLTECPEHNRQRKGVSQLTEICQSRYLKLFLALRIFVFFRLVLIHYQHVSLHFNTALLGMCALYLLTV